MVQLQVPLERPTVFGHLRRSSKAYPFHPDFDAIRQEAFLVADFEVETVEEVGRSLHFAEARYF